jgi:DNA-binding MarR family transcriptional regulator
MLKPAANARPCHCITLRKATHVVTRLYDAAMEASGLRITQYALLNTLHRLGPASLHALSATTRLERTTLIRNLDVLVKQDLVRITPEQPPQAHTARLTEKGEAKLNGARPLWERAQTRVEEVLTTEEANLLHNLLLKLHALDG